MIIESAYAWSSTSLKILTEYKPQVFRYGKILPRRTCTQEDIFNMSSAEEKPIHILVNVAEKLDERKFLSRHPTTNLSRIDDIIILSS